MLIIDSLAYTSRFRTIHPGIKVLITVPLLLLAVAWQSLAFGLILTAVMGGVSVWGGGTPLRLYLRLLRIPLLFIALSLLAIVVNVTSEAGTGASVCLGPVYLTVSAGGIDRGMRLAASAMGAVSCLYFLALSTPLTDLFYVLEKLRCPYLIMELMLLIYRFLFLLWSIAAELGKAAEGRLGTVNYRTSVRTLGQVSATLLIRALKRSSAIYDAMESRGYDGKIRVLPGFQSKKRNGDQNG